MKLNLPRRTKKRVITRERPLLIVFNELNRMWALGFVHDLFFESRKFRELNATDKAKREALTVEPDHPNHHDFVEPFNRFFRAEVINADLFGSIPEFKQNCKVWRTQYIHEPPHESLNNLLPSVHIPSSFESTESLLISVNLMGKSKFVLAQI